MLDISLPQRTNGAAEGEIVNATETSTDPVILAHLAWLDTRSACCEMCGRERPLSELDAVSTDFVTCAREVGGCDGVSL